MRIEEFFELHKNVAVALSGGVDSAVLLLFAKRYAERVKAYYVSTPFQPAFEYDDALSIAGTLGVELEALQADILSDAVVVSNPSDRCYYCKKRIFNTIRDAAARDGLETVTEGTNASDDISDRPGFAALKEMNILSPLRDCAYTKQAIRQIARENGLPVSDKPSYACLATRIPTGVKITAELLEKTEKAETLLREAGFRNFRVRYASGDARLELGKNETELFNKNKAHFLTLLSAYYNNVYLDSRERTDE
jgi:uncharacterized protein